MDTPRWFHNSHSLLGLPPFRHRASEYDEVVNRHPLMEFPIMLPLPTALVTAVLLLGFGLPPGFGPASTFGPIPAVAQEGLPRVAPEVVRISAAGLEDVTEALEAAVAQGRIAGAVVGVARMGGIPYLETVGVQDLATGVPMTERSLFRIYSMTRAVTSVAAMILWEEGRFELDDPVSDYIPQFASVYVLDSPAGPPRSPSRPITVRDLMLHTSGLSPRNSQMYRDAQVRRRDIPMPQFIANIVAVPLMEDPGTRYRYSAGTTVLGALIEIWSGRPMDEFMQERIFGPLGMVDTGFWVRPEDQDRLTTVYSPGQGGALEPIQVEEVPFTERPALLEGAVGLVSTVPDFLRFSQMLLNFGELGGTRVLRTETVARITSNGLSDAVLEQRSGTTGWGLGNVSVVMDRSALDYPTNVGEYTWNGSVGGIFWNDPSENLSIVLMWQNRPTNPDGLRQRLKTLVYEALLD